MIGIGGGECANEANSIPNRVVATGVCAHSPPPTAFIDAAVTPNQKAVSDVAPPLKTKYVLL